MGSPGEHSHMCRDGLLGQALSGVFYHSSNWTCIHHSDMYLQPTLCYPPLFRLLDRLMFSECSHVCPSPPSHHFPRTFSPLFFFSFLLPLALPPFSPLAPPLPLLLALPLLSHPPYSGRSHKLLINFSRIRINTKRSTSIEFRKNCPVWIYIYLFIYFSSG